MERHASPADPSEGATRWLRAALLVLLGWWTLRLLSRATGWVFLDYVNLAFHEAGHVFLGPFGHTIGFAGGTIFQLLIPAGLSLYFLFKRRSPFAAACCLWWLGESLIGVATYMADARDLELPLVGGGEHDWNELFYQFGVLGESSVRAISRATRAGGALTMLVGLAWAVVFVLSPRVRAEVVDRITTLAPWSGRLFDTA